jgi:creatinine amidohydrolase
MQWENLTSTDFGKAVQETGVCILALGVLERHSEHLPLGTDMFLSHRIACRAAEAEPAVVFPPFYFGQIYEARCFPGTLTLRPTLLIELVQSVLAEIGRNGFRKIILFNGHGGNTALLRFLAQCTLWEEANFSLYVFGGPKYPLSPDQQRRWDALLETKNHGHACECETSVSLAIHPELVHMERVPAEPAEPLNRMGHLPGNFSGISWYANYPNHYAGDARPATAEKGRALLDLEVEALAGFIRAVKADQSAAQLQTEFFQRSQNL